MDTLKNPRLKFIRYAGMHKNPIIPASVRFVIWTELSKFCKDEKQTFLEAWELRNIFVVWNISWNLWKEKEMVWLFQIEMQISLSPLCSIFAEKGNKCVFCSKGRHEFGPYKGLTRNCSVKEERSTTHCTHHEKTFVRFQMSSYKLTTESLWEKRHVSFCSLRLWSVHNFVLFMCYFCCIFQQN